LILREPQAPPHRGGRFLYGVRPTRTEGSRLILELTGIGGAIEKEDRSLTDGALREAWEEIGCPVRLLPCHETIVVRGPRDVARVQLSGEERPAAAVFRGYRTPPHQPWREGSKGRTCLIVFLAELDGEPKPVAESELPGLLWLKPAHIVHVAREDIPLHRLLALGAELIERETARLPREAWARLTDSQEALALALGSAAIAFYQAMAEGEPWPLP
jgi:8-oxo-dGTP pyrophosphatase MutT (NUDIX family)